jgi:hypothetical protein
MAAGDLRLAALCRDELLHVALQPPDAKGERLALEA